MKVMDMKQGCGSCGGCDACHGCGCIELTEPELWLVQELAQYSFLPVARKASDMKPVYLEDQRYDPDTYSLALQCLEKRGLVDIDYGAPLQGANMDAYKDYPVHGSVALTGKGLQVLDIIEKQGFRDENL